MLAGNKHARSPSPESANKKRDVIPDAAPAVVAVPQPEAQATGDFFTLVNWREYEDRTGQVPVTGFRGTLDGSNTVVETGPIETRHPADQQPGDGTLLKPTKGKNFKLKGGPAGPPEIRDVFGTWSYNDITPLWGLDRYTQFKSHFFELADNFVAQVRPRNGTTTITKNTIYAYLYNMNILAEGRAMLDYIGSRLKQKGQPVAAPPRELPGLDQPNPAYEDYIRVLGELNMPVDLVLALQEQQSSYLSLVEENSALTRLMARIGNDLPEELASRRARSLLACEQRAAQTLDKHRKVFWPHTLAKAAIREDIETAKKDLENHVIRKQTLEYAILAIEDRIREFEDKHRESLAGLLELEAQLQNLAGLSVQDKAVLFENLSKQSKEVQANDMAADQARAERTEPVQTLEQCNKDIEETETKIAKLEGSLEELNQSQQ